MTITPKVSSSLVKKFAEWMPSRSKYGIKDTFKEMFP